MDRIQSGCIIFTFISIANTSKKDQTDSDTLITPICDLCVPFYPADMPVKFSNFSNITVVAQICLQTHRQTYKQPVTSSKTASVVVPATEGATMSTFCHNDTHRLTLSRLVITIKVHVLKVFMSCC